MTALEIKFPYEISWLHFDEFSDYGKKGRDDLGYFVAYNALDIKATIYVYPKMYSDSGKDVLELELANAIAEIKSVHGDDEIQHDFGVRKINDHIINYYISKHEPQKTSSILIFRKGEFFAKLRCTFFDENFMREIAVQINETFVSLMRNEMT